ncbi:MAG TPA: phosphate acyltransferase PlsX [Anaerolineales bacterium]|nr:phosphate acyltransferase PlsX [Anaerolineales bacterium]
MRIVLDAMGSDAHPAPEIEAAASAVRLWPEPLILTGPERILRPLLDAKGVPAAQTPIVDAPEVLRMADHPAESARDKSRSSMAVGIDMLRSGEADAFVTAGNTGGAMATALLRLGRIRGVKRPALTALFPVQTGHAVVVDLGANAECRPEYLVQFAIMGSVYAKFALGVESPRVGLLSNGEEAGKGSPLVKEAHPLLAQAGLNFVGNVESKEFFAGEVDVIVTDGFTGNIFLKTSEAVARFLVDILRREIRSGLMTSVGGLLAMPAFRRVRRLMDPAEVGAAPLLGVDGLVFIGHGRSDARAVVSALRTARQAVERNLLQALRTAIGEQLHGVRSPVDS